jgi:hypothetical protein
MNGGTRVRTTIVKVPDATPGLLFVNGQQKSFTLEGVWKSAVAPAANMSVDVDLDAAGNITAITVVDSQQLAKERMSQLGDVAQERGKEAAKLAQQGLGALIARMGAMALGSAMLVWISWFFLPAATISGGMVGSMTFTFWALLGIDFNNPASMAGAANDHGLFAMLGIVCIAAPFAAPFIKTPWSHYLNAAPLAFVLLGWVTIYMGENKAFGELSKLAGGSPFSFSWGIFVLLIAAAVLATGALKKPVA